MTRRQAAGARILGRGKQLANRVERLEVGDRVRARRAADRLLVDEHDVGDDLRPLERPVRTDLLVPVALLPLDGGIEHVVHQRRLARAAHTRDTGQRVQRDGNVDILQVVLGSAGQRDPLAVAAPPGRRDRNGEFTAQILRGERPRLEHQRVERARKHHAPALLAGADAHVDDVVGHLDHVGVMLDHQHGVALVAQLPQDVDQPQVVAGMQADRRFVQHVERADERRAERRGEVDALRFAARQRR